MVAWLEDGRSLVVSGCCSNEEEEDWGLRREIDKPKDVDNDVDKDVDKDVDSDVADVVRNFTWSHMYVITHTYLLSH